MTTLIKKFSSALESATSPEYKSFIYKQAYIVNLLNITTEAQFTAYHYISQLAPKIARAVFGQNNTVFSAAISKIAMSELRSHSSINIESVETALEKAVLKVAYPNTISDEGEKLKNYDINKWSKALNDIHMRARIYGNKRDAINFVTQGWNNMDEKMDFERWMKYYEKDFGLYRDSSRNTNGITVNAFGGLPIPLQAIPGLNDKNVYRPESGPIRDGSVKEKKPSTTDEIKKKLMARITSAKKLLATPEGRDLAGPKLERLWAHLQQFENELVVIRNATMLNGIIKRAINAVNKSDLNEDSKELFNKVAQLPPLPDLGSPMEGDPGAKPEGAPGQGGGQPAGDPNEGQKAIDEFVLGLKGYSDKDTTPNAIKEKFDNIESEYEKKTGISLSDKTASWVNVETAELKKLSFITDSIGDMVKHAKRNIIAIGQLSPEAPLPTKQPARPVPSAVPEEAAVVPNPAQDNLQELDSDDSKEEYIEPPKKKKAINPAEIKDALNENMLEKQNESADSAAMDEIDRAFSNIKLTDVINRLQALSRVFKNREIARQLSIIDIMLDKLGISGFFPALAEATRSALESNQYCQTRVEELLSKLISATNEKGESILNNNLSGGNDSVVDNEMKEYMHDEAKEEPAKPQAQPPLPSSNVKPAAVPPLPTNEPVV